MLQSENWNFTVRAKSTAVTVLEFNPKTRGVSGAIYQLPFATVLATLKLEPVSGSEVIKIWN